MLFTKKKLIALLIPLLIEQALNVTIGMADTMMVASCGEAAVSGISLVDSLNFLMFTLFGSLSTGGAVITSQYMGKGDTKSGCESANQLVMSVTVVAVLCSVFALIFRGSVLDLVFGSIAPDVRQNALTYFAITVLGYPFIGLYTCGTAMFRAMGNSKLSLYTSIVMNLINICGNALLIFGLGMGVAGAAIATLFSRICGSAFMLYRLSSKKNPIHLVPFLPLRLRWDMIKNILRVGIPNGLENSMFQIGKVLVSSLVATFGTAAIAANAVTNNVTMLQGIPGGAFSMAIITVVGQCVGAGDYDQAKKYTRWLMLSCAACTGLVCLVSCIKVDWILALYNLSDETASIATVLIWIHGAFLPFIQPFAFVMPNVLRASGDVKYTMIASILSMWLLRIVCCYILSVNLGFGIYGVYISMVVDWAGRGIAYVIRYMSGKWKGKALV